MGLNPHSKFCISYFPITYYRLTTGFKIQLVERVVMIIISAVTGEQVV